MNRLTKSYNPPELSLDELRAYQAGQLSGPARNRVERLMLDNPFYADALDGLEALQQVGSSLHAQTRDLHEALQERVHESATTRRLMPLWVTSLVASVLLVMSVAIYLIFRPTAPQQQAGQVMSQAIEPGTVLLNPADLGPAANVPATNKLNATASGPSRLSASAGTYSTGTSFEPALRRKKQLRRLRPEVEELPAAVTGCTDPFAVDKDIILLPTDQDVANRQRVNTERAFLR